MWWVCSSCGTDWHLKWWNVWPPPACPECRSTNIHPVDGESDGEAAESLEDQ